MNTVILPWMPKELSPNSRCHWAVKSKKAKQYRNQCRLLAIESNLKYLPAVINWNNNKKILFEIDFYKPSRRGDDDNLEAQFKSGRDGISDAIGIDDKYFIAVRKVMNETVKGGKVVIRILEYTGT
jgi:crossover junction endodeoxyribonuclease RusA